MKKKILFGITDLNFGGAERVLVDIVNKLSNKFDITILTIYNNGGFEKELNKNIKTVSIYNKEKRQLRFLEKILLSLKMIIKKTRDQIYIQNVRDDYDVEVSFLEGPISWILSTPSKAKKIAWIHNDVSSVFGDGLKAFFKKKLSGKCYSNYDQLVFVSEDNLKKFTEVYPTNIIQKKVIYNYLNKDLVIKKSNMYDVNLKEDNLVSFVQVSRIVPQKGLLRLIDVHKKLIDNGLFHRIYVVGDGKEIKKLEEAILEKNVKDTFILLGKKENPYPYIKAADYFMLTSYYEGYPMVLLEARALNKYILITDSAARETLIGYEKNSIITKNSFDGIYEGIKSIIEKRPKVSNNVMFNNSDVIDSIIDLIEGE